MIVQQALGRGEIESWAETTNRRHRKAYLIPYLARSPELRALMPSTNPIVGTRVRAMTGQRENDFSDASTRPVSNRDSTFA